MQIVWREKLLAFVVHFAVTLFLAAAAAALIFLVWFPDPFQTMVGGTQLFMLVVGCDLVLGPLISLVIYNSRKSRKELLFDYSIVGAVQLAALIYGIYVVSASRPVYVAFVQDRFEVVTAIELEPQELADAKLPEFKTLPKWGPQLVATHVPEEERNDALFAALEGRDVSARPRFYVPFESQRDQIKALAKPLSALYKQHKDAAHIVMTSEQDLEIPLDELRWLPVKAKDGFWTALIDSSTGKPAAYVELDPY